MEEWNEYLWQTDTITLHFSILHTKRIGRFTGGMQWNFSFALTVFLWDDIKLNEKCTKNFDWKNVTEEGNWSNSNLNVRIMLKWISGREVLGMWTGLNWLSIGSVRGFCCDGDGPLNSTERDNFLKNVINID